MGPDSESRNTKGEQDISSGPAEQVRRDGVPFEEASVTGAAREYVDLSIDQTVRLVLSGGALPAIKDFEIHRREGAAEEVTVMINRQSPRDLHIYVFASDSDGKRYLCVLPTSVAEGHLDAFDRLCEAQGKKLVPEGGGLVVFEADSFKVYGSSHDLGQGDEKLCRELITKVMQQHQK